MEDIRPKTRAELVVRWLNLSLLRMFYVAMALAALVAAWGVFWWAYYRFIDPCYP